MTYQDAPGSDRLIAYTAQAEAQARAYVAAYVQRHPGCTVSEVVKGRKAIYASRSDVEAAVRALARGRNPQITGIAPDGSRMRGISRGLATLWPAGMSGVLDPGQSGTPDVPGVPRRERAAALRKSGISLRLIAAELHVSHPTVLRDLRAAERAEIEAVLVALGADPPRAARGPSLAESARLGAEDATGRPTGLRWEIARRMRGDGASVRQIAAAIGEPRSTVARHLADPRTSREWRRYRRHIAD